MYINIAVTRQLIRTARTLEAEWWQVCGEAWVRGQRKMSQVPDALGLLEFTMLRPVLAWRAFLNLWTIYFFNFPIFFSGSGQPCIMNPRIRRSNCIYIFKIITLITDVFIGQLGWYRIHSTEKHSSRPSRIRRIMCLQGSEGPKLNTVI